MFIGRQSPTLWTRELTTYDLVSRGESVDDNCWGKSVTEGDTGYGPGFQYSCIHSGVIKTSGDLATNWYNYALASAGTIIDEDTSSSNPATNTAKADESVCPKGWTLPSKAQADSNRNIALFSPVLGGYYVDGDMYNETTRGHWWGSEAYSGGARYRLLYNGSIYTGSSYRHNGISIRCVQKST